MIYEGNFKDDKRHGQGTLFDEDKGVKYFEGIFNEGIRTNQGTKFCYCDGEVRKNLEVYECSVCAYRGWGDEEINL